MTGAGKQVNGLVPIRRFPEFREAADWQQTELGQFLKESRIIGSRGDVARKLTVKLWGRGVAEKNETTIGSENTQYYKRRAGQFIYSKLDFLNKAFGIIPDHLDGLESTVDLPCLDIGDGLNPKFLLEFVQRDSFYKKNGEIADGGRKAKRIQVEDFRSFLIDVPPEKAEQQKIADCLSSLDALIAAEGDRLEALKAHKKALMQQLFPAEGQTTPRLRFPEFQKAGDWEWTTVDAIAQILKGKGISKADIVANGQQQCLRYGELYTTYSEVIDEVVSRTNVAGRELFLSRKNDVIIPSSGETKIDIATAACVLHDNIALGGDLNVIRSPHNGIFLSYFFNGPLKSAIARVAQGDSVVHLYPTQIGSLKIALPSMAEQTRIAETIFAVQRIILAQRSRLLALKAHKSGLMQQLFPATAEAAA